ncbi:MAG: hypothetical protein IIU80_00745 [Clostridia bacterium]|nr:hypothetical protein [Clostridia bacterium]
MKKSYKILLIIIGIEFLFVAPLLNELNVQVQSWLGNAIGVFVSFLPIEILLYLLSKDEKLSVFKRGFAKVAFWFITFSYVASGVAEAIQRFII